MDDKVEELKPDLTETNAIELSVLSAVEVMYTNKFYAAVCNEGVIKLYFADLSNKGDITNIEGVVMTLSSLYSLQQTLQDVIKKIAEFQSKVIPMPTKPNREPLE